MVTVLNGELQLLRPQRRRRPQRLGAARRGGRCIGGIGGVFQWVAWWRWRGASALGGVLQALAAPARWAVGSPVGTPLPFRRPVAAGSCCRRWGWGLPAAASVQPGLQRRALWPSPLPALCPPVPCAAECCAPLEGATSTATTRRLPPHPAQWKTSKSKQRQRFSRASQSTRLLWHLSPPPGDAGACASMVCCASALRACSPGVARKCPHSSVPPEAQPVDFTVPSAAPVPAARAPCGCTFPRRARPRAAPDPPQPAAPPAGD
jgi:hypothetical protein